MEISPTVLSELKTQTEFRGVTQIVQAMREGWMIQVEVKDYTLVQALALDLDRGEAEAIALALQLGRSQVLIDEADGRSKARSMGLRPIGVLGVLLQAKKIGQIDSVRSAMNSLRKEIGFYIAEELFNLILVQAGEK